MKKRKKKNKFMRALPFIIIAVTVFSISFMLGKNIANKKLQTVQASSIQKKDENEKAKEELIKKDIDAEIIAEEEKVMQQQAEAEKLKLQQAESEKLKQQQAEAEAKKKEQERTAAQNASATVKTDGSKVAYLTFDDGPTYNVTPQVLNILKNENVKATFFVVGNMAKNNPALLKREKNEGHVIANHSYTHIYKQVYASTDSFLEEITNCNKIIDSIVGGHNDKLVRFPGGSYGKGKQVFKDTLAKSGYHYADWNCLTGDQDGKFYTKDQLVKNFKISAGNKKELIILMHDIPSKSHSVQAIPEIIRYLKSNGYEFRTLQ